MKKIILIFLLLFSNSSFASYTWYLKSTLYGTVTISSSTPYTSSVELCTDIASAESSNTPTVNYTYQSVTYWGSNQYKCNYQGVNITTGQITNSSRTMYVTGTSCSVGTEWDSSINDCVTSQQCEAGLKTYFNHSTEVQSQVYNPTENINGCEYEYTDIKKCYFAIDGQSMMCIYEYTSTGVAGTGDPIGSGDDVPPPDEPNPPPVTTQENTTDTPVVETDTPNPGDTKTTENQTEHKETTEKEVTSTETDITGTTSTNGTTTSTKTTTTNYSDGSSTVTVEVTKIEVNGAGTVETVNRGTGQSTVTTSSGTSITTGYTTTTTTNPDGSSTSTTSGTGIGSEQGEEEEEQTYEPGEPGEFDLAGLDSEIEQAKGELSTIITNIRNDAEGLFSFSGAGGGELPCWSFTALNTSYSVCLGEYEDHFNQIGFALVIVSLMLSLLIIAR